MQNYNSKLDGVEEVYTFHWSKCKRYLCRFSMPKAFDSLVTILSLWFILDDWWFVWLLNWDVFLLHHSWKSTLIKVSNNDLIWGFKDSPLRYNLGCLSMCYLWDYRLHRFYTKSKFFDWWLTSFGWQEDPIVQMLLASQENFRRWNDKNSYDFISRDSMDQASYYSFFFN